MYVYIDSTLIICLFRKQSTVEDTAVEVDPLDVDNDEDGFTENDGDCDDFNNTIHPGASEILDNGVDEDCNGEDELIPNLMWMMTGMVLQKTKVIVMI